MSRIPNPGTTIPDNEDLNQDNTLSDLDEYYSYNIDLNKQNLHVGSKFIVDQITPTPTKQMRLLGICFVYLSATLMSRWVTLMASIHPVYQNVYDWIHAAVVLRMANFRSVGNRWRAYTGNLQQASFSQPIEPNVDNLTVSAVNVEDNGQAMR